MSEKAKLSQACHYHIHLENIKVKPNSTILVVDDEVANTTLLGEVLKKAGYGVNSANDGFKAIAACKVRTPDAIVLDLHMPLMGGMEVYNRLRSEEKTASIPIIFLAARDKSLPTFSGDDASNEDIIFKPIEPTELLSRVKSVLKEKALRDELKRKEQQIKELTLTDALTSLKSSRYLDEFMQIGIRQAKRYSVPMSVVVMELDNHAELAKSLNAQSFDALVSQVGGLVAKQMRESDIVVRTNTCEFTVVLTCTSKEGAIEVAERLRTSITTSTFAVGADSKALTCSVGICQYAKHMDDDGSVLMSHARAAVSHAHASGGNMTLMAE
ncbi:MAG: response regulator [Candidatus Obscuribacter sp.]|nr:response regulator [Candidatus Obscuribacter sp.]MDQ5965025.1 Response regulator [Cyanobacteriota bacterium erpe_2018_sw_39hr_WHONDRS-SW48-000098_B_bin.30]MBK7837174.1 response regulator [Candidatus Obscuribacter sp.]MBK9201969.1 response regulator [Candidatus Obscuribacter sp.]MBK9620255.1 response regulator [Candidatus Obscuribacter sp.]